MSHPLIRPSLTYEELSRLPDDGQRYELFDGEAYVSPSPSLWHQDVLFNLALLVRQAVRGAARVFFAPMDVVLAPATVPQPDLVVVLAAHANILKDVIRGIPDLVVEVLSPSSAEMDRGIKMKIYARHGIPEYWIVDLQQEAIEVYRLAQPTGAYRLAQICRRGERVTTPLLPGLSIAVDEVFTVGA